MHQSVHCFLTRFLVKFVLVLLGPCVKTSACAQVPTRSHSHRDCKVGRQESGWGEEGFHKVCRMLAFTIWSSACFILYQNKERERRCIRGSYNLLEKPLSGRKVEETSQALLLELIKPRAIRCSARVLKTARSTQDHVYKIGMPKPSWCLKYHNEDNLCLT